MSTEIIYRDPQEIKDDYQRLSTLLKSADITDDTRELITSAIVKLKQEKEPLTKLSYAELEETLVDMFKIENAEQLLLLFELCKLEFEQLLNEGDLLKYGLNNEEVSETIVNLNRSKQAQLESSLIEQNEVNGFLTVLDIVCACKGKILKISTTGYLIELSDSIYANIDNEQILVKKAGELISIPKVSNPAWCNGWRLDIPNKFDKDKFSFKNRKK